MLETNVKLLIQTKIIHLLNNNDISMRRLSIELGLSDSYISQILNNNLLPSIRTIIHLCDYFDLPLKDFFDESIHYPPEYYLLLTEIQKLSAAKMNGLYVVLHQENNEESQNDSDV
ncbi:MAG: helix-turn-helix transcriptional regulator [Lachnospiraceae bacterium]|nr:helix-turn-helix transcriptional regulator [Lachnospiraceae bacterium]